MRVAKTCTPTPPPSPPRLPACCHQRVPAVPCAGIDPSDPASLQFLWHKGGDFVKAGTPIPLIFRIATVEDVRPADRVPSRRLWLTAGGGSRGGGQQQPRHQQQQGGGGGQGEEGEGHQQRGRGRRRYKPRTGGRPAGWQHDDRGDGEGGDVDMGQQRKARRPRNKRWRQGGDVEMEDADAYDGDGGGYQVSGRHGGGGEGPAGGTRDNGASCVKRHEGCSSTRPCWLGERCAALGANQHPCAPWPGRRTAAAP